MAKYDIIFWGWDKGEKHRLRGPIQANLSTPLSVEQEVLHGVVPLLDRMLPERPVVVFEEGEAETADSEKAFHVVESKPKQKYPGIPA